MKRLVASALLSIPLLCQTLLCQTRHAADLGREVVRAGLDPTQCYRVRDLEIQQDEARFYLTDGYLMFGKPVNGKPLTAVFSADTDGGDAEVLLLPPDSSERRSLAAYAGSPNLNEHFDQAAFLFTDDTAKSLLDQLTSNGAQKAPNIAPILSERWNQVVNNLMSGFESRIVLDILTPSARGGFFEAVIQGKKLGNFDVIYDARGYEQLIVGQMATGNNGASWETWTSFVSRSHRGEPPPAPEERILDYKIDVRLAPDMTMRCRTRMRVRTTPASRDAIALDMSGQMRALSARVDGVEAEVYERDSVREGLVRNTGNELLLILPAKPLEPDTEHEIEIEHEGKVVMEGDHNVFFVTSRGSWYPSRGLQFVNFDVTYHYPKSLDLVAAGRIVDEREEGEERITHRAPEGPVRLLGFNLGKYERREVSRGGVTVEICANRELENALRPRVQENPSTLPLPEPGRPRRRPNLQGDADIARQQPPAPPPSPAAHLVQIADQVDAAILYYRSKFGEPPVKRIEVSPIPGRFGQGFPGMIYLPTLNYTDPSATAPAHSANQAAFFRDLLVAHEVAHQWWGNIISAGSYHHEWIMESLANYSAIMYLETRIGAKAVETALESYRKNLFAPGPDGETPESLGPVVQGRRLETSSNPNAATAVVYGKGTWIIHMLRRRMGDDGFLKMLGELRRRFEYKTFDTEAFRLLCAEFMPKGAPDAKFENFFDQWVYSTGVPTLKLVSSVKGKPGAYKLTGTVTQSDAPEDFTVAVPVEIQTGRAKPAVQMVRTASEPVSFTVPVPGPAAKAVLDPGWSVLRR